MEWLNELRRRLRILFRGNRFHADLEEEIQFHIERQAEENRENGADPEEAQFAARRQFGNVTRLRETSREQWGWTAGEAFARDLRCGWRALRRAPGFTAMALLTLALGVGVNTAMFSVLRAVLLRPLPYRDPARLVRVWQTRQRAPDESQLVRPPRRNQAVARVRTMEEILSSAVAGPRFNLTLLGGFAAAPVGLAAMGVYGVIAYLVSQRRNEIGVRMALGAQSGAVIRYVLARGMTPVAAGVVIGVAGALAATRVLRSLLYGIGPTDPVTFAFAVLLLAVVALGAGCAPARRATKIDPMEAIRHE